MERRILPSEFSPLGPEEVAPIESEIDDIEQEFSRLEKRKSDLARRKVRLETNKKTLVAAKETVNSRSRIVLPSCSLLVMFDCTSFAALYFNF